VTSPQAWPVFHNIAVFVLGLYSTCERKHVALKKPLTPRAHFWDEENSIGFFLTMGNMVILSHWRNLFIYPLSIHPFAPFQITFKVIPSLCIRQIFINTVLSEDRSQSFCAVHTLTLFLKSRSIWEHSEGGQWWLCMMSMNNDFELSMKLVNMVNFMYILPQ
jgi:hypothetical protein